MAPFRPAGEVARWRIVYDLLCKTETGNVLTYAAIGEALGLDAEKDRHAIQMAIRRAAKEHETADRRAIEVVPNRGYRVVETPEHLRLARSHHKRASKSLVRGQSKVVNADLSGLEPQTRRMFEVMAVAFTMQMDFAKRLDVRQAKLEDAVSGMTERTERTEQEIADLKARLARLEGDQT